MSRDIVFVYDHFYPDYSAGGPVTSLANLARLLEGSCIVKVLTSSRYYDTRKTFDNIPLNQWTSVDNYTVWYADSNASIDRAIETISDDGVIYLNGIFSPGFFLHVIRRSRKRKLNVVISPRGMLQEGALLGKSLKKRAYLFVLKMIGTLKSARWHATDPQERVDIRKHFGPQLEVDVIPNVPRRPVEERVVIEKRPGALKLVYFSLISRKKNLKFLLEVISSSELEGITLDIIGPIKDPDYWKECTEYIMASNQTINYLGDCDPSEVNALLSRYHLFVLPTHGENFGHAIIEAMSTFRPVMISEHTPWKDIQPFAGGFSLPLVTSQWEEKLKEARDWSQHDFDRACEGAMNYFKQKINMSALRSMYLSLFRISS